MEVRRLVKENAQSFDMVRIISHKTLERYEIISRFQFLAIGCPENVFRPDDVFLFIGYDKHFRRSRIIFHQLFECQVRKNLHCASPIMRYLDGQRLGERPYVAIRNKTLELISTLS